MSFFASVKELECEKRTRVNEQFSWKYVLCFCIAMIRFLFLLNFHEAKVIMQIFHLTKHVTRGSLWFVVIKVNTLKASVSTLSPFTIHDAKCWIYYMGRWTRYLMITAKTFPPKQVFVATNYRLVSSCSLLLCE